MGDRPSRDMETFLPLKPPHFLILLALSERDLHGYAIKKEILRRTDGAVPLGAGTLYRSIRQLADRELIEPSDDRPDPALDDERRQYYRLTGLGRRVARAESERLAALVHVAQASSLHAGGDQ